MPDHHSISYSRIEAKDFAQRLGDELAIGEPSVRAWLDVRDIPAGVDWDEAIGEAIKTCETLIFIMTPDSVRPDSECKNEWLGARYKKAVVLLLNASAEAPFRLYSRQHIDCTGESDGARRTTQPFALAARRAASSTISHAQRTRLSGLESNRPRRSERQVVDQLQLVEHPERVAKRGREHRRRDRARATTGTAWRRYPLQSAAGHRTVLFPESPRRNGARWPLPQSGRAADHRRCAPA